MDRLCERPGCSEPASVAYGMRAEDLVFWLDRWREGSESDGGVLCQRHADTMVVPRNWTLDDLRDPELHLFRPPPVESRGRQRVRREHVAVETAVEQLALGVDVAPDATSVDAATSDASTAGTSGTLDGSTIPSGADAEAAAGPGSDVPGPWSPSFDAADDLDGLLSARTPLLARAFRGDDRPRR